MKWISFSLITLLVLNSTLFDIKIATQAFFTLPVCMVCVFQSFYFQPICVLFKVHLVKKTYTCVLLFETVWLSSSLHLMVCIPTDMRETWVQSLGREDPLEKDMAAHSSILAWRILWTEAPGGLQSTGSQSDGLDWATEHTSHRYWYGLV